MGEWELLPPTAAYFKRRVSCRRARLIPSDAEAIYWPIARRSYAAHRTGEQNLGRTIRGVLWLLCAGLAEAKAAPKLAMENGPASLDADPQAAIQTGPELPRWGWKEIALEDRSGPELPRPWILSAPLGVYRGLMLLWALWLAFALMRWLRWGWSAFGRDPSWGGGT